MGIKLINFMCHSHFEIKFNPRINFISGSNGSGKSAIQTAMVIGLGGVASKTNRSSKLGGELFLLSNLSIQPLLSSQFQWFRFFSGLIKDGCQNGSIMITLSNHGWNSYKFDEFGESITIVRNINQSSSTYRVYNHQGNRRRFPMCNDR